jgi:hypothetical protein
VGDTPDSRPDQGRTVARILKADDRELVVEFADGTRLFATADARLDVSVT